MTAAAMRPVRERLVFVWFAGYMILPILALLYYYIIYVYYSLMNPGVER